MENRLNRIEVQFHQLMESSQAIQPNGNLKSLLELSPVGTLVIQRPWDLVKSRVFYLTISSICRWGNVSEDFKQQVNGLS